MVLKSKSLLIIGAGGFGRTVAEAALLSCDWDKVDFADDSYPKQQQPEGYNVVATTADVAAILGRYDGVVVAIGNNKVRMEKLQYLEQLAAPLVSIFHPKAIISARATIGVGSLVMAGAVVGAHALIGKGCILNPNAVADHDSVMDDFSHLGVGACIPGTARLMKGAWLRAGVSVSYGDVVPEWLIAEPYRDFLSKSST